MGALDDVRHLLFLMTKCDRGEGVAGVASERGAFFGSGLDFPPLHGTYSTRTQA